MAVEKFSAWFFEQPGLVQDLVLYGPPLLVSMGITAALGGRIRLICLSWFANPTLAIALENERREAEAEKDAEWTYSAKASVDEMIAKRRRGIH